MVCSEFTTVGHLPIPERLFAPLLLNWWYLCHRMKHTMIPITAVADTRTAGTPITMAAMIPLFNPLAIGWGCRSVGGGGVAESIGNDTDDIPAENNLDNLVCDGVMELTMESCDGPTRISLLVDAVTKPEGPNACQMSERCFKG